MLAVTDVLHSKRPLFDRPPTATHERPRLGRGPSGAQEAAQEHFKGAQEGALQGPSRGPKESFRVPEGGLSGNPGNPGARPHPRLIKSPFRKSHSVARTLCFHRVRATEDYFPNLL